MLARTNAPQPSMYRTTAAAALHRCTLEILDVITRAAVTGLTAETRMWHVLLATDIAVLETRREAIVRNV